MSDEQVVVSNETKKDKKSFFKKFKFTAKSIIQIVFIAIFIFTVSAFPVMYICGVSAGKNYEQKVLTKAPDLDVLINNYTGFSDQFEQHFNDYFPMRSDMLELYSLLEYKVFNTSLLPETTSIGHNGWLFYESWGTRDAVSGEKMLSEKALEKIYNGLMAKYNKLKELGKQYVVYLAAEKQMIYPEHDRLTNAKYTLIDQLMEYLESKNCPIPVIYSRDYLLSKKTSTNQLFFKYDTHWNLLGAHYGYEDVMTKVKELLPAKNINIVKDFELTKTTASGDLASTIFLSKYLTEETPIPVYKHTPAYVGVGPITKVTSDVNSDLKVFIYGDSFAQAHYWGASFVQSACETRIMHNSNTFQTLLDNLGDSDVVIEECVQRVPTTLGRAEF